MNKDEERKGSSARQMSVYHKHQDGASDAPITANSMAAQIAFVLHGQLKVALCIMISLFTVTLQGGLRYQSASWF